MTSFRPSEQGFFSAKNSCLAMMAAVILVPQGLIPGGSGWNRDGQGRSGTVRDGQGRSECSPGFAGK